MNNFLRKISSRKLWVAMAGMVTGVAMLFGVKESEITTVSGAVVAMVSAVAYIIAEGEIDAERVKNAVESTEDALCVMEGGERSGSQNIQLKK